MHGNSLAMEVERGLCRFLHARMLDPVRHGGVDDPLAGPGREFSPAASERCVGSNCTHRS